MIKFILGRKLKMSQIFDKNGKPVPVTLISAGPCFVTVIKTKEKDGYSAVQIGYGQAKKLNKPETGHLRKIRNPKSEIRNMKLKTLREFRVDDIDEIKDIKIGDEITLANFKESDEIEVSGISKGKGFSGVIKRHNFSRGPETHGSDHHRHPGSIGSMFPQKVIKGRKMPGHMGFEKVTVKGLKIIKIIPETNILMLKGAIPGPNKSVIEIRTVK